MPSKKPKYTIDQAYKKGHTFDFGSQSAGIKLYLDHRFKLTSDLKASVEMTRLTISPELYAKLLNCQATLCTVRKAKFWRVRHWGGKRSSFLEIMHGNI